MYGREINDASKQSFKPFFEDHITSEAQIKTDEWTGYLPLKKNYQHLQQIPSGKKGENFQLMHRSIMMFKALLHGTHHAPDPQILNAKKFGVPQNRERIFIVGFRSDLEINNFKMAQREMINSGQGHLIHPNRWVSFIPMGTT